MGTLSGQEPKKQMSNSGFAVVWTNSITKLLFFKKEQNITAFISPSQKTGLCLCCGEQKGDLEKPVCNLPNSHVQNCLG